MSELEERLRRALVDGVEAEPEAGGLAAAARGRARARRRTHLLAVVVAVLVAGVAVPLVVAAGRSGDGAAPAAPTPAERRNVPDGWRTESWRDVELQVPGDWGYGALSAWCLGGTQPPRPVVERWGAVVPAIGCSSPANGYGVQFFPNDLGIGYTPGPLPVDRPGYPRGAWVAYACGHDCAAVVRIVTPSRVLAQRVLDSVHEIRGADGNGCAPSAPETGRPVGAGTVSVCRYDAEQRLEQSELLTGQDARRAVAALEDAPRVDGSIAVCMPAPEPTGYVQLQSDAGTRRVVLESACPAFNGVFTGDRRVALLSRGLLYWALSPGWSGGVSHGVPLPHHLRHRP